MNDKCCPSESLPALELPKSSEGRWALMAEWSKALGHPSRVQIIEYLLLQDGCVCGDIAKEVGSAQSTVSQHLKILKDSGLIQGTIDGPRTCYCVHPEALRGFQELVQQLCLTRPATTSEE